MPVERFDRGQIRFKPLRERRSRVRVPQGLVAAQAVPGPLPEPARRAVAEAAAAIRQARAAGRPAILAFGAHAIKNGLAPVLIHLIEAGWLTHLATNGAGIIHDWELAFQGATSEDVRENVARGEFGLWEETGYWLSLALNVGAWRGLGYGEAVGSLVEREGLELPSAGELQDEVIRRVSREPEQAAAAADLLAVVRRFTLPAGFLPLPHPHRRIGLQAAAFRLGVPFTAHPMFGHDILYAHPMCRGAAIGRAAERDFLSFVHSVSGLEGGVYLSVGSAVMSPMIFEKSLSMARNVALREGRRIEDFRIYVVDLAPMVWDWQKDGEPPADHPAYYLRYLKTFSRMGGRTAYIPADNRDFLLALREELERPPPAA
jgi:hypothetical protein